MITIGTENRVRFGEITLYTRNGRTIARKARNNVSSVRNMESNCRLVSRSSSFVCMSKRMPCELRGVLMSQGGKNANTYLPRLTKYNYHNMDVPSLTKTEVLQGVEILYPAAISNGIVPTVTEKLVANTLVTNITVDCDDREISTVEELSNLLINTGRFECSDSLVAIIAEQDTSGTVPRFFIRYDTIELDLFDSIPLRSFVVEGGRICYKIHQEAEIYAATLVHTTSSLAVSTERLFINNRSLLDTYLTSEHTQAALKSYAR